MNIYCIGIGGIGMSAYARFAKALGHTVSGTDKVSNETTKELQEEGIAVYLGHDPDTIPERCDLVLTSPGVPKTTADCIFAKEHNIPIRTWQEHLGVFTKEKKTIAVCGTHGKSTTTAMIALLLMDAGLDPTVLLGTKLKEFGGSNMRVGKSEWFVIEADEYGENFLNYHPDYIVLTSYEPDHLDYFKTTERYQQAYIRFFTQMKGTDKTIIYHAEGDQSKEVVEKALQQTSFAEVGLKGTIPLNLQVLGEHNRRNASLVAMLGRQLGISEEVIQNALASFSGTWRRMELKGTTDGGALVYDDYGHHPNEVKAVLQAMREGYPEKHIVCIFQPHQHSRTKVFLKEFAQCFFDADTVIIPNIYESRDTEEDMKTMTTEVLVDEIAKHHPDVHNGEGLEQTVEYVLSDPGLNTEEAVIVVMGAGDVTGVARELVNSTQ